MSSKIPILTLSLAQHLHGTDIQDNINKLFVTCPPPELAVTLQRFNHIGFNISIEEPELNAAELKRVVSQRKWAGIVFGWCIRGGSTKFTELYEQMMDICVEYIIATETSKGNDTDSGEGRTKLIFCRGPEDLVNAVLRNFSASKQQPCH